jgi:hypothetical protein
MSSRLRFVASLLAIIFLATQFHFCADLTSGPAGSHLCPLCSTAGFAVAPGPLSVAVVPVTSRLEISAVIAAVCPILAREVSPRAPPAL